VKQQLVDLSWYDFLQIRSYIQLFGFVKISFLFVCDTIYIKHRHKIMGEHKKFFFVMVVVVVMVVTVVWSNKTHECASDSIWRFRSELIKVLIMD
jgi:cell division protein FtsW (lipid II flippase)